MLPQNWAKWMFYKDIIYYWYSYEYLGNLDFSLCICGETSETDSLCFVEWVWNSFIPWWMEKDVGVLQDHLNMLMPVHVLSSNSTLQKETKMLHKSSNKNTFKVNLAILSVSFRTTSLLHIFFISQKKQQIPHTSHTRQTTHRFVLRIVRVKNQLSRNQKTSSNTQGPGITRRTPTWRAGGEDGEDRGGSGGIGGGGGGGGGGKFQIVLDWKHFLMPTVFL